MKEFKSFVVKSGDAEISIRVEISEETEKVGVASVIMKKLMPKFYTGCYIGMKLSGEEGKMLRSICNKIAEEIWE